MFRNFSLSFSHSWNNEDLWRSRAHVGFCFTERVFSVPIGWIAHVCHVFICIDNWWINFVIVEPNIVSLRDLMQQGKLDGVDHKISKVSSTAEVWWKLPFHLQNRARCWAGLCFLSPSYTSVNLEQLEASRISLDLCWCYSQKYAVGVKRCLWGTAQREQWLYLGRRKTQSL